MVTARDNTALAASLFKNGGHPSGRNRFGSAIAVDAKSLSAPPDRRRDSLHRNPLWTPRVLCQPLLVVDSDAGAALIPTVTLKTLALAVKDLADKGIGAVMLTCEGYERDADASEAASPENAMMAAIAIARAAAPDMQIMIDTCLCAYTADGSCWLRGPDGAVDIPTTLDVLCEQAIMHASKGADVLVTASMLDGAVEAVRTALDAYDHHNVAVMPRVTLQSHLHGTRQVAAHGARHGGSHALDPNRSEAVVHYALALLDQGADMLALDPALHAVDLLVRIKARTDRPLALIAAAGDYLQPVGGDALHVDDFAGLVSERLDAYVRAGADTVITHHTAEAVDISDTQSLHRLDDRHCR